MSATICIVLSLLLPIAFIAAVMAKAYRDENYIARRSDR
jgi:hypothetical protein